MCFRSDAAAVLRDARGPSKGLAVPSEVDDGAAWKGSRWVTRRGVRGGLGEVGRGLNEDIVVRGDVECFEFVEWGFVGYVGLRDGARG